MSFDTVSTTSTYNLAVYSGDCYNFWLELILDSGAGITGTDTKYVHVQEECPERRPLPKLLPGSIVKHR
jgi:hypothetical protein